MNEKWAHLLGPLWIEPALGVEYVGVRTKHVTVAVHNPHIYAEDGLVPGD